MKVDYKALEAWYRERILAGASEGSDSFDCYEDESGFTWFINKREDGKYDMTTCQCPVPFAVGMITKTGKARIRWKVNG